MSQDNRGLEWFGVESARAAQLELLPQHAIEELESDLDLTSNDIAIALSADRRTVDRWRTGQTYPQHEMRRRLSQLWGLRTRLRETFSSPEAVRTWMRTPNRYLAGLTPLNALHAGRLDRVEAAVEALDSGVFL